MIEAVKKDKKSGRVTFILKNANPALANGLRRLMIEGVPSMAIEEVEFANNNSALFTITFGLYMYHAVHGAKFDMVSSKAQHCCCSELKILSLEQLRNRCLWEDWFDFWILALHVTCVDSAWAFCLQGELQ